MEDSQCGTRVLSTKVYSYSASTTGWIFDRRCASATTTRLRVNVVVWRLLKLPCSIGEVPHPFILYW